MIDPESPKFIKIAKERKAICNTCKYNKLGFCTDCKCLIAIKVFVPPAECGLGKWDSVDDEVSD